MPSVLGCWGLVSGCDRKVQVVSFFYFSCDEDFFGDVVQLVIGYNFWVLAVEGDS